MAPKILNENKKYICNIKNIVAKAVKDSVAPMKSAKAASEDSEPDDDDFDFFIKQQDAAEKQKIAKQKMKIAINGFGRIGRLTFRNLMRRSDEFEVVAIIQELFG